MSDQSSQLPKSVSRRNVLLGAAAATAALATGTSLADGHEHKGHQHHNHANPYQGLIDSALDCIKKGELCDAHCITLVKQGDTSIADCMAQVSDMLPMCGALVKLSANQSSHLKALAQVCVDVCQTCEDACREHEKKHVECKECAESCAECVKACKAMIAA